MSSSTENNLHSTYQYFFDQSNLHKKLHW